MAAPFIATRLLSRRRTARRVSRHRPTVLSDCSSHHCRAVSCAACPPTRSGKSTLASAIHVIELRDFFLVEQRRNFAVGQHWDPMARRQLHRSLGHPFALRSRLISQDPAQPFSNQIAQRRAALHGRYFGALQKIVRQVERRSHKYAFMFYCLLAVSRVHPAKSTRTRYSV